LWKNDQSLSVSVILQLIIPAYAGQEQSNKTIKSREMLFK
jgi:hypothetical protein